jgi:uncharacterized RDD family membrane protein YckC
MEANTIIIPVAEIEYPSLSDRIQSTFIDTISIILMMFIFSSVLENLQNVSDWIRIFLFIALWILYDPLCTSLGCTIGNYVKGIRVRQREDHSMRINFFQALIRYILKIFLGWLSFLTVYSNVERRALHDIVVGSVVVKA